MSNVSWEALFDATLDGLSKEDLDFLVSVSPLKILDEQSCRFVTGYKDAFKRLDFLSKNTSFIERYEAQKFRFHDLFRDFLLSKLSERPGLRTSCYVKAAQYYEAEAQWQDAIDSYIEVSAYADAIRLLRIWAENFYNAGMLNTLDDWLLHLFRGIRRVPSWLFLLKAQILEITGRRDEALQFAVLAVKRDKSDGNMVGVASALNRQGVIYLRLRKYIRAREAFEEALDIRKRLGDVSGEAQVMGNLGDLLWLTGNYQEAETVLRRAVEINQQSPDLIANAISLSLLGKTQRALGKYDEALRLFHLALDYNKRIGDLRGQNICEVFVGDIHFLRGEFEVASKLYESTLRRSIQIGNKLGTAIAYKGLAQVLERKGNYKAALEYCDKATTLNDEIGDQRGKAIVDNLRSRILIALQDYDTAIGLAKDALDALRTLGDVPEGVQSRIVLGEAYCAKGDFATANSFAATAETAAESILDKHKLAAASKVLGVTASRQFHYGEAIKWLEKSLALLQELDAKYDLASVGLELAKALWGQKDSSQARKYLKSVIRGSREQGFEVLLAEALEWQTLIERSMDPNAPET